MNIFKLSWNNLRYRPLSSLLSLLLIVLGVSIISLLLMLGRQLERQLTSNIQDIDLVMGAKGSPLQLVLSSCYHIDNPTGNISLKDARRFMDHPMVREAIPLSYGDSYQGYRIVGTEAAYVHHYGGRLAEGRLWEEPFEATLGAQVAQKTSLSLGDTFYSSHGLATSGYAHDDHGFVVQGILKPTQTVLDQLILTETSSIWRMHQHSEQAGKHPKRQTHGAHDDTSQEKHHDHHHTHAAPEEPKNGHNTSALSAPKSMEEPSDDDKEVIGPGGVVIDRDDSASQNGEKASSNPTDAAEVTAVLLKLRNQLAKLQLPRQINRVGSLQAAVPTFEIQRLRKLLGFGTTTLQALGLAVMLVAAISVFIALFNNLKDRRYEMALMRSMGLAPRQLFFLVLLEGFYIGIGGFLLGVAVSRGEMLIISNSIQRAYQYTLSTPGLLPGEWYLLAVTSVLTLVAAALPAWRVMQLDISRTLSEA